MKIIGIDPGKQTGMAIYDKALKKLTDVWTTNFWECYEYLESAQGDTSIIKIVIEVPRTKTNWHKKGCDITSANVGGIYMQAHLLAEGIKRLGFTVVTQHPQGKVDSNYIKQLTGWTKRTNPHQRDAIMLCWGY